MKEDQAYKEIHNPWDMIAYLLRFRLKELLAVIIILLAGYILIANVSCDSKNGISFKPSVKVEIKKK